MLPFKFLLDENISPSLVSKLWAAGLDSVSLRDRSMLGVSDAKAWDYAQTQARTFVTINECHLRRFARRDPLHSGLLTIPSGGSRADQLGYIIAATRYVWQDGSTENNFRCCIAEVDCRCNVTVEFTNNIFESLDVMRGIHLRH